MMDQSMHSLIARTLDESTTMSTNTSSIEDIYRDMFYTNEIKFLVNLMRPFALLSIVGSTFIIWDILRTSPTTGANGNNRKQKISLMTNRIMLGLGISDIVFSCCLFVSSWAVPKGQCYGSAGTVLTCTIQGFLSASACTCSQFYNATLSLCYLLMVRYNWSEEKLQRVQGLLLVFPLIVVLPFTIPSLLWKAYNYDGINICSGIAPYPLWCADGSVPCERGSKLVELVYAQDNLWAAFTPQIMCSSVILTSMTLLYWSVLKRERANDQYRFEEGRSTLNRAHSNRVAMQGICYVWAFLLTWSPWIFVIAFSIKRKEVPIALRIVSLILMPCQGFFNTVVYLRPRLLYGNKKKQRRQRQHRQGPHRRGSSLSRQSSVARLRSFLLGTPKGDTSETSRPSDESYSDTGTGDGDDDERYFADPSTVFLLPPAQSGMAPDYGMNTNHKMSVELSRPFESQSLHIMTSVVQEEGEMKMEEAEDVLITISS